MTVAKKPASSVSFGLAPSGGYTMSMSAPASSAACASATASFTSAPAIVAMMGARPATFLNRPVDDRPPLLWTKGADFGHQAEDGDAMRA
jgi:hypothetical protein